MPHSWYNPAHRKPGCAPSPGDNCFPVNGAAAPASGWGTLTDNKDAEAYAFENKDHYLNGKTIHFPEGWEARSRNALTALTAIFRCGAKRATAIDVNTIMADSFLEEIVNRNGLGAGSGERRGVFVHESVPWKKIESADWTGLFKVASIEACAVVVSMVRDERWPPAMEVRTVDWLCSNGQNKRPMKTPPYLTNPVPYTMDAFTSQRAIEMVIADDAEKLALTAQLAHYDPPRPGIPRPADSSLGLLVATVAASRGENHPVRMERKVDGWRVTVSVIDGIPGAIIRSRSGTTKGGKSFSNQTISTQVATCLQGIPFTLDCELTHPDAEGSNHVDPIFSRRTGRATFNVIDAFDPHSNEHNLSMWDICPLKDRVTRVKEIIDLITRNIRNNFPGGVTWSFKQVGCIERPSDDADPTKNRTYDADVMTTTPSALRAIAEYVVNNRWEGLVLKNTSSPYPISASANGERMPLNQWTKVRPDMMPGWHFATYAIGYTMDEKNMHATDDEKMLSIRLVLALKDGRGAYRIIAPSCNTYGSPTIAGAVKEYGCRDVIKGTGAWADGDRTVEYMPIKPPFTVNAVFDYRHMPPERRLQFPRVRGLSTHIPCLYEHASATACALAMDCLQPKP